MFIKCSIWVTNVHVPFAYSCRCLLSLLLLLLYFCVLDRLLFLFCFLISTFLDTHQVCGKYAYTFLVHELRKTHCFKSKRSFVACTCHHIVLRMQLRVRFLCQSKCVVHECALFWLIHCSHLAAGVDSSSLGLARQPSPLLHSSRPSHCQASSSQTTSIHLAVAFDSIFFLPQAVLTLLLC